MQTEFTEKNNMDWKKVHRAIFGEIIPRHCLWDKKEDILEILNLIGGSNCSTHLYFPDAGGNDFSEAKEASEKDCIELVASNTYIIKPKALVFDSIHDDLSLNYFKIETNPLPPSNILGINKGRNYEELTEISPNNYVQRYHWDLQEYDGEKLPETARVVIRFLKGSFVIFMKSSPYYDMQSAYIGLHEKLDSETFKKMLKR
ncbi:MAG: hypothetical protein KKD31_08420 [Bacteroidetes bacterium]|nr:hypothetical protein [Bacteroidota bacterium]